MENTTQASDAGRLEGIWQPVRAELEGELAPDFALEKIRLILRAGNYRVELDHEEMDFGNYRVRAANERDRLDLEGLRGTNAGRRIPALYQLRGDRLRVCYGLNGADPNEFHAPANSAKYLVTYRRILSEENSAP